MSLVKVTITILYDTDTKGEDPAKADMKAFRDGKYPLDELLSWADLGPYYKFENYKEEDNGKTT